MLFELTGAGRPDGAALTVADDGITATGGTAPTWTTVAGVGKAIRFPTTAIASTVWKNLDGTSRICKITLELIVDAAPSAAMEFLHPRHGTSGATRSGSALLNTTRTTVGRNGSDTVFAVVTAATALTLNDVYVVQYVLDAGTTSSNGRGMMRVTHKATGTVVYESSSTGMSNANVVLTQARIGKFTASGTVGMLMRNVRMSDEASYTYLDPIADAPGNAPPTANAGPDVTVEAGASVTLTGTDSDSDGTIATRTWSLSGTQVGTGATLTFTAPVGLTETTRTYTYTVTDNAGASTSDTVVVTIRKALISMKNGDGSFTPLVSRLIT